MKDKYSCEVVEETFGNNDRPCNNGDTSVEFLNSPRINTGNRAYQREKVTLDSWKQELMRTVLINVYARIPEIHIRVIKTENGWTYELIDGQQRVTAIIDFLNGDYRLPPKFVVGDCDCSGMDAQELYDTYPSIYELIGEYRISCKWYEELTDLQTADLFINVLNNVNDMKPQEIRNAILGHYSEYVRKTARFEPHEIFERTVVTSKKGKKSKLTYFSSKFALKQRMEVDEWLSEFIYLWKNGVVGGVQHKQHFNWVASAQQPGGIYNDGFKDETKINELLNFGLSILKAVDVEDTNRLNPMTSMMLILYANDLKERYGSIIPENYASAFFKTYDKYSDTSPEVPIYTKMTCTNGHPMGPFKELFGGKNSNAISTIFTVLNHELESVGLKEFGIIEIDTRDFKRADIIKKWKEQGGKCYYTGKPLELNNIAGDHFIPRSSGVENGGVTEYTNLVVCSRNLNNKKGNMSAKSFQNLCKLESNIPSEEAA